MVDPRMMEAKKLLIHLSRMRVGKVLIGTQAECDLLLFAATILELHMIEEERKEGA